MTAFTPRRLQANRSLVTGYDYGAHVATWTLEEVPVVWVSRESAYTSGVAIRGGVPICWPWFANGPHGDRSPSHGVARTQPWTFLGSDNAKARWSLSSADLFPASVAAFPHRFDSMVSVDVDGAALRVSHRLTNTGSEPLSYEIALHTYLHVGDVRAARITGLDGVGFFDKTTQRFETQTGDLRIDDECDRIYTTSEVVTVVDPRLNRTMTVTGEGCGNVVVWNPGPSGAAEMQDFADDEWTEMVCVESANIGEMSIHLAPGQSHTTSAIIEVAPYTENTTP